MKKIKQRAATTFTIDSNGQRLAHVALAETNQRTTLYAEDLERLLAAGWSPFWMLTRDRKGWAQVSLNAHNREERPSMVPVARLLADAERGQRVRMRDGDTLNLRSENFHVHSGFAQHGAADWFPSVAAVRAAGVSVEPKRRKRRAKPARAPQGAHSPHGFTADFREGI
jgi:hypothetical protein